MKYIFAYIVPLSLIGFAFYLAVNNQPYWGWLIFAALLSAGSITVVVTENRKKG